MQEDWLMDFYNNIEDEVIEYTYYICERTGFGYRYNAQLDVYETPSKKCEWNLIGVGEYSRLKLATKEECYTAIDKSVIEFWIRY